MDNLWIMIVYGHTIIFQLNSNYQKTEIKNHKIEVVGRVIDQYRTANQQPYIRYEYSFEGITYQSIESLDKKPGNFLHKYYKVNISERKPHFSIILLDKEVNLL